jgi:hypothetical protein
MYSPKGLPVLSSLSGDVLQPYRAAAARAAAPLFKTERLVTLALKILSVFILFPLHID